MSNCKWAGRGEPRILPGRHDEDCADADECPGCAPCVEPHCCVCRRAHAAVTCAECVAATRDDLRTIATLCDALPKEAEHRGVNGEAMMLVGPTADPEAWRNRAMSAMRGRVDAAYLEDCRDEQHPLWVLGTWEQLWRDHLDQPTDLAATLPRLVAYLDAKLHVMAEVEEVPFEDLARDLRGCRGHLEDVLRDGDQRDTGAPCMTCDVPLELTYGDDEKGDTWHCPRCRQTSSRAQYLFAVRQHFLENATELTAEDMAAAHGVPAGSVRGWASEKVGKVRKRGKDANGLQLYDVADVLATRGESVREPA